MLVTVVVVLGGLALLAVVFARATGPGGPSSGPRSGRSRESDGYVPVSADSGSSAECGPDAAADCDSTSGGDGGGGGGDGGGGGGGGD